MAVYRRNHDINNRVNQRNTLDITKAVALGAASAARNISSSIAIEAAYAGAYHLKFYKAILLSVIVAHDDGDEWQTSQ